MYFRYTFLFVHVFSSGKCSYVFLSQVGRWQWTSWNLKSWNSMVTTALSSGCWSCFKWEFFLTFKIVKTGYIDLETLNSANWIFYGLVVAAHVYLSWKIFARRQDTGNSVSLVIFWCVTSFLSWSITPLSSTEPEAKEG